MSAYELSVRFMPWRFTEWCWPAFCIRCDRPASRWHRARCDHRHLVLAPDEETLAVFEKCAECGYPFANVTAHDCDEHRAFMTRLEANMARHRPLLNRLRDSH